MAAPVAHIFVALALLNSGKLKVDDKQAFILGTSFPDIRYLNVIKREKTHKKNVTWGDVVNASSSFEAGMLLHALLDRVREDYVETHHLYDQLPNNPYRAHVLKFFEDTLLYNYVTEWPQTTTYFDTITQEEKTYGITMPYLRIWHKLLQQYISQHPSAKQIAGFLKNRSTVLTHKESNIIKHHLNKLISSIKNQVIAFKLGDIIKKLEKNNTVRSRMIYFYENVADFLTKD